MHGWWIVVSIAASAAAGCERAERIPPPPADAGPPPPHPRFEHVNAWLPTLEQQLVRWRIKADISRITSCYEAALLEQPGLQGTVHTTFCWSRCASRP